MALAAELGRRRPVDMVAPQPHELLSTYYRAADVCLVPSRSESFGLVALEAAACGTPVVASAVGGLTTLVDHGRTGFLVDDAEPDRPSPTTCAGSWRSRCWPSGSSTAAVLRARALHLARRRRPRSGRSTTSWSPAGSSSAPEATATAVAPLVDLPRGEAHGRRWRPGSTPGRHASSRRTAPSAWWPPSART